MKILVTGFEAFKGIDVNPSGLIVEKLANRDPRLVTGILPVVYGKSGDRMQSLITEHQPDAVVMLGVAGKRGRINLERVAVNLNDAPLPDNDGLHADGELIINGGPVGYWSTLPLNEMKAALEVVQIPVEISNHAGTYMCNHVFYLARNLLESTALDVPCGFIHVPKIGDEPDGLPLDTMVQAMQICIDEIEKSLTKQPASSDKKTPSQKREEWQEWQKEFEYGTFVIWPPDDVREIVNQQRAQYDPLSHAICEAHISLTQPFLQKPTARDWEKIQEIVAGFEPFEIHFGPLRIWESAPVLWYQIEPAHHIVSLRNVLHGLGLFNLDRPFTEGFVPHMTILDSSVDVAQGMELYGKLKTQVESGSFVCQAIAYIVPDDDFHLSVRRVLPLNTSVVLD